MLITGGSRGIGAATAVLAAKAGYAVAINYRDNAQAAAETANAVEAAGGEAWCVQADVANESDIMAMFAAPKPVSSAGGMKQPGPLGIGAWCRTAPCATA